MANYITVDGGTTNTRLYLVKDRKVTDTIKLPSGIRDGLSLLKKNLKVGITSLLAQNRLESKDICCILASGMITSEYGLCELEHIKTPVGVEELGRTVYRASFPDICEIEWVFIRGVKNDASSFESADMIRGEETEIMGLSGNTDAEALYILPGSHSKHISVDGNGRIINIKTMLSGELFAAVMKHTILSETADFEHACVKAEQLNEGVEYCSLHGINEALFKTRVLKNMFGASKEDCYSFLLGVVLCDEIKAILNSDAVLVVIGGQKHFRNAISILLNIYCHGKRIITLSDEEVDGSVALGAVSIYERVLH